MVNDSEFSYIKVQFSDQNSKPIEIEDKISITLVINQSIYIYKKKIENIDKSIRKNVRINSSGKYSQKLIGHDKESATDALKTYSKRVIQKTAIAVGDLIGNKIAY